MAAVGEWVAGISAVSGLVTGTSSARTQGRLNKRALGLQEDALAFAQEQYDDWMRIYGPIQDNLGEFFGGLTADTFSALGLEAYQKEFEQQQVELDEFFATNDIDLGIQTDITSGQNLQRARDRAEIKAEAPFKVAEVQQSFLSAGSGQKDNAVNAMNNARSNLSTALINQANQAGNDADRGFDAFSSGLSTLSDYYDRKSEPEQETTVGSNSAASGSTPVSGVYNQPYNYDGE